MKESELLRALQSEIQKHNLSTFMDEKDKIVITGCTLCRKNFGTVEQFKRHITEDVGWHARSTSECLLLLLA
jgi:hypothetical protein